MIQPCTNGALRISAGCDGGELVPVGFSGVEQDADAVVGEATEPEPDPFDALDQVVDGFGGFDNSPQTLVEPPWAR